VLKAKALSGHQRAVPGTVGIWHRWIDQRGKNIVHRGHRCWSCDLSPHDVSERLALSKPILDSLEQQLLIISKWLVPHDVDEPKLDQDGTDILVLSLNRPGGTVIQRRRQTSSMR